jgi:hypothetical protein
MPIGYRSIGNDELEFLINSENPVYGKSKYSTVRGCGSKSPYGIVCFFAENFKWVDSFHVIDIQVRLPDDAERGIATYMASKDFGRTRVYKGREGKTEYKVEELYVRYYEPKDVIEINLRCYYASHYVRNAIMPFCKKYNIRLIWENKDMFNSEEEM